MSKIEELIQGFCHKGKSVKSVDSSLSLGMTNQPFDGEGLNGGGKAATIQSPFPSKTNSHSERSEETHSGKHNSHSERSKETKEIPPLGTKNSGFDDEIPPCGRNDSSPIIVMVEGGGGFAATSFNPSLKEEPVIPNETQWREESPLKQQNAINKNLEGGIYE